MSRIQDNDLSVAGGIPGLQGVLTGAGGCEVRPADRQGDGTADRYRTPEKLFSMHSITWFPRICDTICRSCRDYTPAGSLLRAEILQQAVQFLLCLRPDAVFGGKPVRIGEQP